MKLIVVANNRLEKRLQVPMAKALTLPVLVDGEHGYAIYVTHNAFAKVQPTDQEVVAVGRAIADAINKGARA